MAQVETVNERPIICTIASRDDVIPIGLLYQNREAMRYNEATAVGVGMTSDEKLVALNAELDRFAI